MSRAADSSAGRPAGELVFLKLGGSLLTDKARPQALRPDVLGRLAAEIADARANRPEMRLLVGHGSGSFGHVAARRYGTRLGVRTRESWRGYAETAQAAARLHRHVMDALWDAGIPALSVPPSASALCHDGELHRLDDRPVRMALQHGLVPVVYGDVALDDRRGGTIVSTEQVFRWLAGRLAPQRVILVGEVEGVLSADPSTGVAGKLVPQITRATLSGFIAGLGASRGVDVTGGMVAKVEEMLALAEATPSLSHVQIISGTRAGLVRSVLVDPSLHAGTRIHG